MEDDLILGDEEAEVESYIIDPIEVVDSAIAVLHALGEANAVPPYPDYNDDRVQAIIRSMGLINKAQAVMKKQLANLQKAL